MKSALYVGRVHHARAKPKRHRLTYRMFMLALDLDEVAALSRRLKLFSHNRANLLSFHDRDHGVGKDEPLRPQIEKLLRERGIEAGGAITLLSMPRVFGYVFNPLSLYFCRDGAGDLKAIVYEVGNTFGERHFYVLPVENSGTVRQSCAKEFYVSPFMAMGLTYAFEISGVDEDKLSISILASDKDGPLLSAGFVAHRQELTDATLLRAWASHPLLTFKVIAGIHCEALLLWLKGVRFIGREQHAPVRGHAVPSERSRGL